MVYKDIIESIFEQFLHDCYIYNKDKYINNDEITNKDEISIKLEDKIIILDFISDLKIGQFNNELYELLKSIFFHVEYNDNKELKLKVNSDTNNFWNNNDIKTNINAQIQNILMNKKSNTNLLFEYLKNLTIKYEKEKEKSIDNKQNNQDTIKKRDTQGLENKKDENLDEEFDVKNKIYDYKDNDLLLEEINKLKKNLVEISIKTYFKKQINKYNITSYSPLKNYINNNNGIENYLALKLSKENQNMPIICNTLNNLINLINSNDKYPGENIFGFIIINGVEYLYAFHNDEEMEKILFDAEKIKKINYLEAIDNSEEKESKNKSKSKDNGSEKSVSKDNSSIKSGSKDNGSIKSEFYKNNNQNFDKISSKSKKAKTEIYSKKSEHTNNIYDSVYFRGSEFENNANLLFKSIPNIKELPNYFYVLGNINDYKILNSNNNNKYYDNKKNNKNKYHNDNNKKKNLYTFDEYLEHLFSLFMETDGAFINTQEQILSLQLTKNYLPYKISSGFNVKVINGNISMKKGKDKNQLVIYPNSIIICESKLSIPNKIDCPFEELYDKNTFEKSLIFVIAKMIKKIKYYIEFVRQVYYDGNEKMPNFGIQLFLIYNNNPIENLEKEITNNLNKLIEKNYVNYGFELKIIYLSPTIGTFNMKRAFEEITSLKEKMQKQEEDNKNLVKQITVMAKELNELKLQLGSLTQQKNS